MFILFCNIYQLFTLFPNVNVNVNFTTHRCHCYNPYDMSSYIVWMKLLMFCGRQGYQDSGHLSPHQRIMVPDGVWSLSCDSPQHLSACCGQFATSCEHLSEFCSPTLFFFLKSQYLTIIPKKFLRENFVALFVFLYSTLKESCLEIPLCIHAQMFRFVLFPTWTRTVVLQLQFYQFKGRFSNTKCFIWTCFLVFIGANTGLALC